MTQIHDSDHKWLGGGIVRGVFTDTIIFEGKIDKPKCNKDIIGGIRETTIKDFTKCINTTPRVSKYIDECPKPIKLKQIKEFKLDNDKGCFITGEPGTGKTYMCKQLQQEILNSVSNGSSYKVCKQITTKVRRKFGTRRNWKNIDPKA